MKKVKIYTTTYCPFCVRVKNLFQGKKVPFEEVNLEEDPAKRDELVQQTGHMTVPLVFIGDEFIGGSDEAHALEASGELDKKLQD